ncbi:hypothetical protein D3C87_1565820 [compost metagenome]
MTDSGHRPTPFHESPYDVQHLFIEAQIFAGPATGEIKTGVILRLDQSEIGIDPEQVSGLFRIGLVALEIVDRGLDHLAPTLAGTDCVNLKAEHLQGLKRHHRFIILGIVTDDHQDLVVAGLCHEFHYLPGSPNGHSLVVWSGTSCRKR